MTDIVVTDPDTGGTITATLTLSDTGAGTLSTGTSSGGVTSTFNNGVWSAIGGVVDVNDLLAAATFTAATDYDQNFTINSYVSDGVATAITGTKNVTVTAVNDSPSGAAVTLAAINEDVATATIVGDTVYNLFNGVFSDVVHL